MASGGSDRNMSEETFDYICTACDEDNVIKEGIKYCVECKGYCCNVCLSAHKKYPSLREHNLQDISTSQQTDQTSNIPSFPTERCSVHQGKVIDMFCGDHDVVGCYACIAIDHKSCTDIHSIPDDVDKIIKDGEFDQTCGELQKLTERLQSVLQNSNANYLTNLENARQNSLLANSEHIRETDAMLDRLEEDAKSEVESMYSQIKSKLLKDNEIIKSCLNKCGELAERNKRAEGNKSQKFVFTKQASSTINNDRYDINKAEKELKDFEREHILSFVADKALIEFLQQFEKFGRVKLTDTRTLYRTKHGRNIVVKIPSDTEKCSIRGGCCLLRINVLIITDNANKKLKRVDIANASVLDYIDLPYDIHGVCCVKNNDIAVVCYDVKMIQFVSIGKTMTPSCQIKLNHNCYHVAYLDNKLYVIDDSGCSVYIYNMVGTLLQTIFKDSKGNELFQYSEQIALCDSEYYMFVGGYNGLVSLDKKGNHIATVKNLDIDGVEGVCVDGRGNVFVAGWDSNNVQNVVQ